MIVEREAVHRGILVLDSEHRIRPGSRGTREGVELGDAGAQCLEARIGYERLLRQRSRVVDRQGRRRKQRDCC